MKLSDQKRQKEVLINTTHKWYEEFTATECSYQNKWSGRPVSRVHHFSRQVEEIKWLSAVVWEEKQTALQLETEPAKEKVTLEPFSLRK